MKKGNEGFSKDYWDKNYSEPEEMDGLANAKEHAHYMKSFFDLELIDVSSVIDFGFGLGYLFNEVTKAFMPYKAQGIEPSQYAFDTFRKRYKKPADSMKLKLRNEDISRWAKRQLAKEEKSKYFDLGICTSVFQYLSDDEIDLVLPVLSKKVKYIYFSVPTDEELKRQVSELDFFDEYAIRRSRQYYIDKIFPYFTIIGARILESKSHFNQSDSPFSDYLFRF